MSNENKTRNLKNKTEGQSRIASWLTYFPVSSVGSLLDFVTISRKKKRERRWKKGQTGQSWSMKSLNITGLNLTVLHSESKKRENKMQMQHPTDFALIKVTLEFPTEKEWKMAKWIEETGTKYTSTWTVK